MGKFWIKSAALKYINKSLQTCEPGWRLIKVNGEIKLNGEKEKVARRERKSDRETAEGIKI